MEQDIRRPPDDLLAELEKRMGGFSKGRRAISSFILKHYDKAAFYTANKLGSTVGISESTVVRFATELGYDGYQQMQRALQDIIRNRLTAAQRVEVTQNRLVGHDLLHTVMTADTNKIRSTLAALDSRVFDSVVDAITSAKTIYVVGIRSASAISGFLVFYLNMIRDNVKLVSTSTMSETVEQVMRAGSCDVVIGISFPRYSRRTLKAMEYARDRGARVIAITDSASSPLCKVASSALLAKTDTSLFVDSLVAPLSLINALIVAVGLRNSEELSESFRKLESVWSDYAVYETHD